MTARPRFLQLGDRPSSRIFIQFLLCTIATLPQFWGLLIHIHVTGGRKSTHAVCCRLYSLFTCSQCYTLSHVFANSDIVLSLYYLWCFGKSLPISFVAVHHHGHVGSHSHQGGVISALGVNDRGITHAEESLTPLTPVKTSSSHQAKVWGSKTR